MTAKAVYFLVLPLAAALALSSPAIAKGKGKGKGANPASAHNGGRGQGLPPGLAKKNRLPPGLAKKNRISPGLARQSALPRVNPAPSQFHWRSAPRPTTHARDRIMRMQRGLTDLGYSPGVADGVLGSNTRAAIEAFQSDRGLLVTGKISERLEAAIRAASRAVASTRRPPRRQPKSGTAGSGFLVSAQGHVLTNAHIVDRCGTIRASSASLIETAGISVGPKHQLGMPFGSRSLIVVAIDARADLAVLASSTPAANFAIFRSARGARTGEAVMVAGFPLPGLLSSDLNVTTGIVSARAGPGDDRRLIQITAPVQPGNSGGPVLDVSGNVVGVVVARLNAVKLAQQTGRLPQNVNFAISGATARKFLDANKIAYKVTASTKALSSADLASKAREFTVSVECRN